MNNSCYKCLMLILYRYIILIVRLFDIILGMCMEYSMQCAINRDIMWAKAVFYINCVSPRPYSDKTANVK